MQRNGSIEPNHDWLEFLEGTFEDLDQRNASNHQTARDEVRGEIEALYLNAQATVELVPHHEAEDDDTLGSLGMPLTETLEPLEIVTFAGPMPEPTEAEPLPPPPVLTFVPDVGWTTLLEFGLPAIPTPPLRSVHRRRARGRSLHGAGSLRSFAG